MPSQRNFDGFSRATDILPDCGWSDRESDDFAGILRHARSEVTPLPHEPFQRPERQCRSSAAANQFVQAVPSNVNGGLPALVTTVVGKLRHFKEAHSGFVSPGGRSHPLCAQHDYLENSLEAAIDFIARHADDEQALDEWRTGRITSLISIADACEPFNRRLRAILITAWFTSLPLAFQYSVTYPTPESSGQAG